MFVSCKYRSPCRVITYKRINFTTWDVGGRGGTVSVHNIVARATEKIGEAQGKYRMQGV